MGAAALAEPIPLRATAAQTRIRRVLSLLATHAVLMAGAVFMLLPFVWMLMTSLKSPGEIFSADFTLWPRRFSAVENYDRALTTAPLLRFALNGFIICFGILVVQLLVAIPAAYALAKLKFPGRNPLFVLVLLGLCIPVQVPALP
ncbi:MAG: carbohydrate transporter permease, partial [Microvirga sp.]|nr:carbohydrate transporter permease [Microvirga sp.]